MKRALMSFFALILSPFMCITAAAMDNRFCVGLLFIVAVVLLIWGIANAIGYTRGERYAEKNPYSLQ